MNAHNLKTMAMTWLRYGRQYPYVASECGNYSADVLGVSSKIMVEVEVKTSIADLRRDFTKRKHIWYSSPSSSSSLWVPNQFYFVVPTHLIEVALERINKQAHALYGLLAPPTDDYRRLWDPLRVIKRAGKLHERPPNPKVFELVAKRMASDLVSTYLMRSHEDRMMMAMEAFAKEHIDIKDCDPLYSEEVDEKMDENEIQRKEYERKNEVKAGPVDWLVDSKCPECGCNLSSGLESDTRMIRCSQCGARRPRDGNGEI